MLGYFVVSIVHRTLTWSTGSLTSFCMRIHTSGCLNRERHRRHAVGHCSRVKRGRLTRRMTLQSVQKFGNDVITRFVARACRCVAFYMAMHEWGNRRDQVTILYKDKIKAEVSVSRFFFKVFSSVALNSFGFKLVENLQGSRTRPSPRLGTPSKLGVNTCTVSLHFTAVFSYKY